MIQPKTILEVIDNTGAQKAICLKIYNKSIKQPGFVGNIILVSIKKTRNKNKSKKIYKKELHKAVITRLKKKENRYDGSSIKFNSNGIILLKKELHKQNYNPIGTRIFGPVSNELRNNMIQNLKVISIASKSF